MLNGMEQWQSPGSSGQAQTLACADLGFALLWGVCTSLLLGWNHCELLCKCGSYLEVRGNLPRGLQVFIVPLLLLFLLLLLIIIKTLKKSQIHQVHLSLTAIKKIDNQLRNTGIDWGGLFPTIAAQSLGKLLSTSQYFPEFLPSEKGIQLHPENYIQHPKYLINVLISLECTKFKVINWKPQKINQPSQLQLVGFRQNKTLFLFHEATSMKNFHSNSCVRKWEGQNCDVWGQESEKNKLINSKEDFLGLIIYTRKY